LSSSGCTSVSLADTPVPLSSEITSLGLTIDRSLTFCKHVQQVSRSCIYHLRALKHIRHLLSQQDANTIAVSLILSRLDYLNSVLFNTSASNIRSLLRLQNWAARVVLLSPRHSSSHNALSTLHWLPIKYRIDYKLSCLVHSILNYQQPAYLHQLLHHYAPKRTLRSSDQLLLLVSRTHLRLTDQSIASAAPAVWNSLPLHLRATKSNDSFRKNLKTHLFLFPT